MLFKILINKIIGYVRITVEGFFIEKFINSCKAKGIFLWGIRREKQSIFHANISINDYKKTKQISKKTKCKVHIERKKGIPFFLNKYRKRKLFLIGAMSVLIVILISSNYIWNIQIIGNERIPTEELIADLQEQGLEVGISKNKFNKNEIINSIRLIRNDISWIGIKIKGTNAIVEIVETDEKPELVKSDEYCNIVATKDAIIQKIDSTKGTSVVKEGDLVKKGSILIGGWMEGKYTGIRYMHASGEVIAKTWYTQKEKVYYKETKQEETGNKEKKYQIKFNNFQINLYKTLSKFEKYDTIYSDKKIKIFSDLYLPVRIVECNNTEIIETVQNYSKEDAKNIAIQRAEEKLKEQIGSTENIANKSINISENNEYIQAEVIYEVLENIGTEEKIVF